MKIYEGTILSCDRDNHVFKYLVEDKGKILHVGNDLPQAYQGAPIEKLGTRALLPSFVDTHLHFAGFAMFSAGLDIRDSEDLHEMGERIKQAAAASTDKFLVGFGASAHCVKEKRIISRKELDAACPDRPIFLLKYDGHACLLNSKLIEMLPRKIAGMRGFHPDAGEMNQEAFFATTDYVTKSISPFQSMRNMLHAVDLVAEKGIGMVHSASGVGYPLDLDVDLERFLGKGLKNSLQMRIFFQTMDVSKVLRRKLPRVGGCFATALDGCFGSEDAALNSPYRNAPNNRGVLFYSDAQVEQFTKRANREGLQIEMHAIGDAAFDQAVSALSSALQDSPRQDHRHTIIHGCLPTAEGLRQCADLGISIALQPSFLYWNLEPLPFLEQTLGERAYRISPLRDMLDMGIVLSGGSDAPCTLPDPIFGIWAACNHYVPEQSVTIQEALKMFTYNGAWTTFDERQRGSIESGKVANMVLLNKNPLSMDPKNLRELEVERLYLQGKPYAPGQGLGTLTVNSLIHWRRQT